MGFKTAVFAALAILIAVYVYYTYTTFAGLPPYVSDETWYAPAAYNILKLVFRISLDMSTPYPNASGIDAYLNPEHPPLVKYIIGISILALGYNALAWRLPGWIIGALALVVAFLLGRKLAESAGERYAALAGLLAALAVALDPTFWALHGIAMLDAYAGFFALLTLYLLIAEKRLASSLALGLAAAAKESCFMLVYPYLYYIGELEAKPLKRLAYAVFIPAAVYLALSAPLIAYYGGFVQWLRASPLHMITWDMQSGHIAGEAVSQISTPWGWFLNINPFYLGHGLYANVNAATMLLWIAMTFAVLFMRDKKLAIATAFPWSMWAGFVAVWLLGNKTLFSFYVANFSPMVDVFVMASMVVLLTRWGRGEVSLWRRAPASRGSRPPS